MVDKSLFVIADYSFCLRQSRICQHADHGGLRRWPGRAWSEDPINVTVSRYCMRPGELNRTVAALRPGMARGLAIEGFSFCIYPMAYRSWFERYKLLRFR